MDAVPAYVSLVFILTTFASIAFLFQAIRRTRLNTLPAQLAFFLVPFWLFLTAGVGLTGFYDDRADMPPRLVVFVILPALITIAAYFTFFRKRFLHRLPLSILTMLHVVRIPVEIVLPWLSIAGTVPRMMTFEGRNFDILSGILAPIVWFIAFKIRFQARWVLVAYNLLGLALLFNVVSIAALSVPSPMQRLNFDQPNFGVLYVPFIWLPAIIVPIALFSHLVSLWRLFKMTNAAAELR